MDIKARIKNPYFWIGLVAVILTAMGVDGSTLTSWSALGDAVKGLVSNPYLIGTTFVAVLGVFVDPSSKGLKDKAQEGGVPDGE